MGALTDEYLENAKRSLIYREDFFPSDWYFGPDYADHCWGLLSKTVSGAENLIAFVPYDDANDFTNVLDVFSEEFFERYRNVASGPRLVLVSVVENMPQEDLRKLVGAKREGRKTVHMLAVDVAAKKLASSGGFGPTEPGARSLGFAQPAVESQPTDDAKERRQATRYFRQRARQSLKQSRTQIGGEPVGTYAIIALNALVFLLLELVGGSTDSRVLLFFGAKYTPYIRAGQWWRLFTYQFLHVGLMHLFVNSFSLYNLGPFIERIYGLRGLLLVYMGSGIMGGLASAALSPHTLSAGASGAIFGLLGALGAFMLAGGASRDAIYRTVGMPLVATLLYGFLLRIDHFAHVGGLVGGFLIAMAMGVGRQGDERLRQAALPAFAVLAALFLWRLL